jgi:urease accessory protein
MTRSIAISSAAAMLAPLMVEPAAAHHVIGGAMPQTWGQGLLSGLGHPIIGLDHFAAVVAVGCLASVHPAARPLALGYVLAMVVGAAIHVQGAAIPATEMLVALSVLALGAALQWREVISPPALLGLFAIAGLIHGYALGESIAGAEPPPLYAYFVGLAVIQSAVALAAVELASWLSAREGAPVSVRVRLIGATIIGIALAALAKELVPGA